MREILFKAKRIDNGEWVYGFIVRKIDPLLNKENWFILCQEYDHSCITGEPTILRSEMSWYKVNPETICQYIEMNCWDKDKRGQKIFTNDIVRITLRGGETSYDYLIGHSYELPCYEAVKLKDAYYNGYDYHSWNSMSWEDFLLYLQDPYGDHESIKVIGNVFDNPELLEAVEIIGYANQDGLASAT